jgi:hypothetical protein
VNNPLATSYTWTLPSGWSGTSVTNSIIATPGTTGGNIIVVANNICGASPQQTLNVTVNQLPVVTLDLSPIDTLCVDGPDVTPTSGNPPGGTYSGSGMTGNAFSPSAAGLGIHIITYAYTDGNGCSNTAADSIFVEVCTGVSEIGKDFSFEVYPNPAHDQISLHINSDLLGSHFTINDMVGRTVLTGQIVSERSIINLNGLAKGIYFLRMRDQYQQTIKVIKQ